MKYRILERDLTVSAIRSGRLETYPLTFRVLSNSFSHFIDKPSQAFNLCLLAVNLRLLAVNLCLLAIDLRLHLIHHVLHGISVKNS